jgi:carbon monoxide dehydrogenase subunit G
MELTNDFVIDRGIDETWRILNDLEFIAPCMPGAQLTEIEGEEYRGLVKIKVGPITANYKGKASFVEQDDTNHVAKLKAEGRDPRQGNANAMVTATMEEVGTEQTKVTIHTDLGLSGKIASFGRGAIEDVSKKLLGQFSDNLQAKLEEPGAAVTNGDRAAAEEAKAKAEEVVDAAKAKAEEAKAKAGEAVTAGVRKIQGPEAEPVDLINVAGKEGAKRILPAVGGVIALILLIWWLINRG